MKCHIKKNIIFCVCVVVTVRKLNYNVYFGDTLGRDRSHSFHVPAAKHLIPAEQRAHTGVRIPRQFDVTLRLRWLPNF